MSITLNGTTGISTPDITSTTAPSLVGTNFTSLPSASLTGALPAIDGSALTGLSAGATELITAETSWSSGVTSITLSLNSAYDIHVIQTFDVVHNDTVRPEDSLQMRFG